MKKRDKRKKIYEDDDGRTVSNMNVEGMPWYSPKRKGEGKDELPKLSKRETLWLVLGVSGASLLIVAIFAGVIALFILFAQNVWFS